MNVFLKKYTLEIMLAIFAATNVAIGGYGMYKMRQGTDAYIKSVDKYDALLDRANGLMGMDGVEVTLEEAKDDVDDEV
jgi:hypothetical protein